MRYQRVLSIAGPKRPWMAAGALLLLSLSAGCGSQYRTVVTPVATSGPAAQITSYAVVIAAPCTSAVSTTCSSSNTTANAGTVTLLDYSGDTIVDQAVLGPNPIAFTMDGSSTYGHVFNADNTISTFAPSTTLQTKDVQLSTLKSSATVGNFMAYSSAAFYLIDTSTSPNSIDVMPGNPPAIEQTISPNTGPLVNLVGANSSQRIYAIGQGASNTSTSCNTPGNVTTAGQVTAIETASNTISNTITVGNCPVYGVMTADGRRAFILNRGSSTISVIDSQKNILDKTITLAPSSGLGPVYAEIVPTSNLLITANYDDNSISVFKIDLDVYGNDSTQFGTLVAHISVGTHPTSLTVLADGSRAYVANQGDGTVSIVNLTSFTVTKVLSVNGNPRTVVSAQDSIFGKVYVISPNSKYCTIIRTDQDIVSTAILLTGYGVDVRMTKTSSTLSNAILSSRISGSGLP